ncbi:hypothetical protein P8831_15700 [Priestia megaterium]|uniref:hypothetical protein n=1 Tax=Priestia megaterium TaxID=1404 RepID=UPI002D7F9AC8|nr:hypothetical protein [Priestia megaterium]MEB4870170.1 hypothetical protein [Priestia megaterium]
MSNFIGNRYENIEDSNIIQGDGNLLYIRQNISRIIDPETKSNQEIWESVLKELEILKNIVRELPDNYEVIRDEQLTPLVSQTKREAEKLKKDPNIKKEGFVEKFKQVLDITDQSNKVLNSLVPHLVKIAQIVGLSGIQG